MLTKKIVDALRSTSVCHVEKRRGTNLCGLKKKAFKDADGKLLKLK